MSGSLLDVCLDDYESHHILAVHAGYSNSFHTIAQQTTACAGAIELA